LDGKKLILKTAASHVINNIVIEITDNGHGMDEKTLNMPLLLQQKMLVKAPVLAFRSAARLLDGIAELLLPQPL